MLNNKQTALLSDLRLWRPYEIFIKNGRDGDRMFSW